MCVYVCVCVCVHEFTHIYRIKFTSKSVFVSNMDIFLVWHKDKCKMQPISIIHILIIVYDNRCVTLGTKSSDLFTEIYIYICMYIYIYVCMYVCVCLLNTL